MVQTLILTGGRKVLVDDEDCVRLVHGTWLVAYHKNASRLPRVNGRIDGGKQRVDMARWLLNAPPDMEVDHINGDTLDNRRCNLRLCTHAENMRNKRPCRKKSSAYKGVYWFRDKWRAYITVAGKAHFLGGFDSELDAALAYDRAAVELHGQFAATNKMLGLITATKV